MNRFRFLAVAAAAAAALALSALPAGAEPYPSRPVQVIVPYAAGGPVDIVARALGQQLQEKLHQPFLVVNQAGASGNIGAAMVARAKPDGQTLLITADTALAANPVLYGSRMGFDPVHDLRPVATLVSYGQMLAVNPSFPAKNFTQFVELAKSKNVSYASAGNLSPGHLTMEQLAGLTGIQVTHVPYRGTAPAVTDLIGGQVDAGFMITPGVVQQVRAHRLVALAVSSTKRSALAPEIPTVAEAGFPQATAEYTFVLMAPAGTDDDIVKQLNGELHAALDSAKVRTMLQELDLVAITDTPQQAAQRLASTTQRLTALVKTRGIRAD